MTRLVPFLFLSVLLCSCAQWWQVRPYPDFIAAEIKAGDQLRIETSDGSRFKLVVVSVLNDRIVGENQVVLFHDILTLEKYSKSSPVNGCIPSQSLGCSVPEWATWLGDTQDKYKDFFYHACEQHDYCYRHGAATYGMDRRTCDINFLNDMQDQCIPSRLGSFIVEVNLDLAECNLIALEFYQVVKKYGANHFKSTTGSYCEYDGPP